MAKTLMHNIHLENNIHQTYLLDLLVKIPHLFFNPLCLFMPSHYLQCGP